MPLHACLDKTSPFYLKISIAALHIISTLHVLANGGDSAEKGIPINVEVLGFNFTDGVRGLQLQEGGLVQWVRSSGLSRLYVMMGGMSYATLPLAIANVCVCVGAIPGVLISSRYRRDTFAMAAMSTAYTAFSVHVGTVAAVRVLPERIRPKVLLGAFALHAGAHVLYQSLCAHAGIVARARRSTTAHLWALRGTCVLGLAAMHAMAGAMPAASWDVAQNPQDIFIVHALVALLPEVLGVGFHAVVSVLRRTLDGVDENAGRLREGYRPLPD
jgi:hypothetical protein